MVSCVPHCEVRPSADAVASGEDFRRLQGLRLQHSRPIDIGVRIEIAAILGHSAALETQLYPGIGPATSCRPGRGESARGWSQMWPHHAPLEPPRLLHSLWLTLRGENAVGQWESGPRSTNPSCPSHHGLLNPALGLSCTPAQSRAKGIQSSSLCSPISNGHRPTPPTGLLLALFILSARLFCCSSPPVSPWSLAEPSYSPVRQAVP